MAKGQFSLVVALYNVADYVPAFLESLRTQSYPLRDLDIVVVDDGSADKSAELVEQWARRHHPTLRLVRQANAGPGAARNAGLKLVENAWVTFCDPDDVFHPAYFQEVANFLEGDTNGSAQLLATRLVQFQDGTARPDHTHPLGRKFRHGNALVNLDKNPEYIQLHGPTVFLRTEVLHREGLVFDERIRPKFEDAHLIGRYLACVAAPVLGVISKASYFYRRNRVKGTSLVAGTWADPRAYSELPRFGYLGMLREIQKIHGTIPPWAQYMVLYDLVWFYIDDKRMHSKTAGASVQQQEQMHLLLEEIISLIDESTIHSFSVVSQGWIFHNILLGYYKGRKKVPTTIQKWVHDNLPRTVRYSYLFHGPEHPEEKFFVDGAAVSAIATKVRDHVVLGRQLIRERIFVLPEGLTVEVTLDGAMATVTRDRGVPKQINRYPASEPGMTLRPPAVPAQSYGILSPVSRVRKGGSTLKNNLVLRRALSGRGTLAEVGEAVRRRIARRQENLESVRRTEADQRLIQLANEEPAVSRYRNAWILMDRIDQADDNAEHLYRHVMKARRDINAWFLLDAKSKDWDRLEREGFRLIPYGSDESVLLALNAAVKISSHANADIEFPVSRKRFGDGKAMFVFLQHGVTKDDMSLWLNTKRIAMMVTASKAEHRSIIDNGTTYGMTSQVVKLTGFPRHDALLRAAASVPVSERRTILIAPTWREYLRDELQSSSSVDVRIEKFEQSDFGKNWLQLLRSPALRELCVKQGHKVVFLPHPELESIVPLLNLPEHVRAVTYRDIRVQQQLVDAHTLVTDYSSIAFDAAYAGARVVYLHFDGEEIFGGGHVYRKGYFDYRRDGLGPVVNSAEDAATEIARRPYAPVSPYAERVQATFEHWDGMSCERTAAEIDNLVRSSSSTK